MIKRYLTLQQIPSPLTTEVVMGHELLCDSALLELLKRLNRQIAIIADSHVHSQIAEKWAAFLSAQGINAISLTFPAGERSKTREMKASLEDQLFKNRCGKQIAIVAIGGGVTTDLVGYLASTFCRGVPFLSIPTTLLAMVDAVIGGKTAVNTPYGKNLVGTFYPPQYILIDTSLLSSLPEREWKNGIAEIIKYGLIHSPTLFEKLLSHHTQWIARDPPFLQTIISESFQIKKEVVEADYQETGYRRILNFGHTVAHAIELLSNYAISHGEAVAMGMRVETLLSYRLGFLDKRAYSLIAQLLDLYGFIPSCSQEITADRLCEAMLLDKKAQGGQPRFVLLEAIGSPVPFEGAYCTPVDQLVLRESINSMLLQTEGAV